MTSQPEAWVLKAADVARSYGELTAVDTVSLELRRGELLSLLGPNGAGKSSLAEVLVGLSNPSAGHVDRLGDVGYAPQALMIWPDLTPSEQLVFLGAMHGLDHRTAKTRAVALLAALGLSDKTDARAAHLSGGMKRRLSLAMAWMNDPPVAVLDEPTAGLDPLCRKRVHDFLRARVDAGASVLLSTHDLDEAERLSDRIAVMSGGRVVAIDTPAILTDGGARTLEDAFIELTGSAFS